MKLIFGMPDGSEWAVDPRIIAEDRATYYADVDGHIIGSAEWEEEVKTFLSDEDILSDWAKGNMDWSQLKAVMVKPHLVDYGLEFVNADCWLEAGL